MLRDGGTLFLDDIHLFSVAQLLALLRQQKEFEVVAAEGKFATLRKVRPARYLPDWRREPYLTANTPGA